MNGGTVDRRSFLALGAGALGVAVAPAFLRPRERLVRLTVPVMGTLGEIAVPARHEGLARQAMAAAAAELRRVEGLMTRFTSGSDVGRFNTAGIGDRVPVSWETREVVREALAWARASGGVFDPTLEQLTAIWDPASVSEPPSETALTVARRESGGWRQLDVAAPWETSPTLLRTPAGALDLGGIAKGYGVDRATAVLREHGVFAGLVNVGGDLAAMGEAPGGRPWHIGIRDPRDPYALIDTIEIVDRAVATSGDYLRFMIHGDRRYHHILDPATGLPALAPVRTATVVAPTAMAADAAATVAFSLGPGRAEAVIRTGDEHADLVHVG